MSQRVQAATSYLYDGPFLKINELVTKGRWSATRDSDLHVHSEETQITIISNRTSLQADWLTDLGSKRRKDILGPAICVTPPAQPHAMDGDEAGGSILIALSPALMEGALRGASISSALVERYGIADSFIQHLIDLLKATRAAEGMPITRLRAESTAVVMIEHFSRRAGSPILDLSKTSIPLASGRLAQVVDYIRANLESDLSIVTLSRIAQMSTFHFARQFRVSTGLTPHQYVLESRVEMAKGLLRNRELSVADVAYACGFATQAHLATVFRRLVGVTPKAYRTAVVCNPTAQESEKQSAEM